MRFSAKSNAKEKEREIYIYYTYIFKFTNNIFRRDFTSILDILHPNHFIKR